MLHKVRADSALHRAMTGLRHELFQPSSQSGGAPFVDLAPYKDFADFHATVSFKSRKNLRNARNRLARSGAVSVLTDDHGDGLAAAIAGSHAGRLDWLDREGQVSRAFGDPAFPALLAKVAKPEDTGLELIAVTIKTGEKPAAYQWGFVHRGRYYAYIASWAPDFEDYSPGKMIMEDVLRACHARGVAVADFLMPASRYKFTWAAGAVEVRDWSAALTLRGRAIAFWNTLLRPALKAAYVRLPAPLRTLARTALTRT
jgi:CelD/BcsL family acetyltransferase involved in cellulose biosynthesis